LLSLGVSQTSLSNNTQNEFLTAYASLSTGQWYDSNHLQGYILHPYLEYERIKNNLKKTQDNVLIDFINRNPDSWLGADINTELLQRLALKKQWGNVLRFHKQDQGGIKAKCLRIEAQLQLKTSPELLNEGMSVWKSASSRPNACDPLFALLKQKGTITDQQAWERITLAMEKGRTSLSRSLSKHLKEPSLVTLWVNLRKSPSKHLNNKRLQRNDARSHQLIAYGIKRIARKETNSARQKWQQLQKKYSFSARIKADVDSYIGLQDAKDHKTRALKDLAAIPANYRSKDANLWMARLALRNNDWHKVQSAISSMTPEDKNRDRWKYWQAHSAKRLGAQNTQQQLQGIAKSASFYGFLAADELNLPYARLLQQERNWAALTPRIRNIPSISSLCS